MNDGIFEKDVFGRKGGTYEEFGEGADAASPEGKDNYVRDRAEKESSSLELMEVILACHESTMKTLMTATMAAVGQRESVAATPTHVLHGPFHDGSRPVAQDPRHVFGFHVTDEARWKQLEDRLHDMITVAVEEAVHNAIAARGGMGNSSLFGGVVGADEADESEDDDEGSSARRLSSRRTKRS